MEEEYDEANKIIGSVMNNNIAEKNENLAQLNAIIDQCEMHDDGFEIYNYQIKTKAIKRKVITPNKAPTPIIETFRISDCSFALMVPTKQRVMIQLGTEQLNEPSFYLKSLEKEYSTDMAKKLILSIFKSKGLDFLSLKDYRISLLKIMDKMQDDSGFLTEQLVKSIVQFNALTKNSIIEKELFMNGFFVSILKYIDIFPRDSVYYILYQLLHGYNNIVTFKTVGTIGAILKNEDLDDIKDKFENLEDKFNDKYFLFLIKIFKLYLGI